MYLEPQGSLNQRTELESMTPEPPEGPTAESSAKSQGWGSRLGALAIILLFALALIAITIVEPVANTQAQSEPTAPAKLVYIPEVEWHLTNFPDNPTIQAVVHARMTARPDLVWHPTTTATAPFAPNAPIAEPQPEGPVSSGSRGAWPYGESDIRFGSEGWQCLELTPTPSSQLNNDDDAGDQPRSWSEFRAAALSQYFHGGAVLSNRILEGECRREDTHALKVEFESRFGSPCRVVYDTFICVH